MAESESSNLTRAAWRAGDTASSAHRGRDPVQTKRGRRAGCAEAGTARDATRSGADVVGDLAQIRPAARVVADGDCARLRLRTIGDLDAAALLLREVGLLVLDPSKPDRLVRPDIFQRVPPDRIEQAIATIGELARPP